jgi:predicted transcriptional regulator
VKIDDELEEAIEEIKRQCGCPVVTSYIADHLPPNLRQLFWDKAIEQYLADIDTGRIGEQQ